ncbi:MAG: GNAT family N-acetyltransferase [Paracoccaceae bacterium]
MPTPMPTIRLATPADRALWEPLFNAYAAFYATPLTDETRDTVWSWIHDPANPFWCALALSDTGQPLGLVQYQLMHRSLGGSMVCYLSDLFTTPEARGQGLGRALIDHVLAFARDRGLPNVRWLTAEDNSTARALYDTYRPRTPFILYSVPTA